ncbi:hypothetical protein SOI69_03525 [Acinetobacter pittii]|uniref:hypothetical protein n=1 Tax=Acinetobacter pittii TaxID=48296 RepID=UPI002A6A58A8|nr:hypothetical protein [Acinetobacter pittii]WPP56351.1 hypothetical protein SOI69_03525 [Acinetobacter pittii]
MESKLLEILPSIHATIVGFFVAFYSAYYIYAIQKVSELHHTFLKTLKEAKLNTILPSYLIVGESILFDKNNNLDWDNKCRELLKNIVHRNDSLTLEDMHKTAKNLLVLFSYFFNSYPFTEKKIKNQIQKNNTIFDINRLREIENRISYMMWIWETSKDKLILLIQNYDEFEKKQLKDRENKSKNSVLEMYKNLPEADRQAILNSMDTNPHKHHFESAQPKLINFFETVYSYRKNILPLIDNSLSEYNLYKNKLNIQKITLFILYLSLYILITGILLPLLTIEIISDMELISKSFAFNYWTYFLFTASFIPYFLVCIYFIKNLKNSIFD